MLREIKNYLNDIIFHKLFIFLRKSFNDLTKGPNQLIPTQGDATLRYYKILKEIGMRQENKLRLWGLILIVNFFHITMVFADECTAKGGTYKAVSAHGQACFCYNKILSNEELKSDLTCEKILEGHIVKYLKDNNHVLQNKMRFYRFGSLHETKKIGSSGELDFNPETVNNPNAQQTAGRGVYVAQGEFYTNKRYAQEHDILLQIRIPKGFYLVNQGSLDQVKRQFETWGVLINNHLDFKAGLNIPLVVHYDGSGSWHVIKGKGDSMSALATIVGFESKDILDDFKTSINFAVGDNKRDDFYESQGFKVFVQRIAHSWLAKIGLDDKFGDDWMREVEDIFLKHLRKEISQIASLIPEKELLQLSIKNENSPLFHIIFLNSSPAIQNSFTTAVKAKGDNSHFKFLRENLKFLGLLDDSIPPLANTLPCQLQGDLEGRKKAANDFFDNIPLILDTQRLKEEGERGGQMGINYWCEN